jgi:spoIIIJ-associated protein
MFETELQKLIEEFFEKSSFSIDSVSITLDMNDGSYWCAVSSRDSRHLIGKNGEMIQTINHLLRRMVEKKHGETAPRVTIDINNYQKERIDKIKTVAHMMAERARFFKSKIELDPMNAYERRIVHDFISRHPDLSSESTGTGPSRRVVIFYKQV